jgi:hypothetical protein
MQNRRLFASYCHDDVEIVSKLCALVRVGHVEVFRDKDGIRPGEQWELVITESLDACDCLVLFWSANSARSESVKAEYSSAMSLGKSVVPVLLDKTELPQDLGKYEWIDFRSFVVVRPVMKEMERTEMSITRRVVAAPARAAGAFIGGMLGLLGVPGSATRAAVRAKAGPLAEIADIVSLSLSDESQTRLIKVFADRLFALSDSGDSGATRKSGLSNSGA